jgi:hypothetical protein
VAIKLDDGQPRSGLIVAAPLQKPSRPAPPPGLDGAG